MKRRLRLLSTIVLAITMVMGMCTYAFAETVPIPPSVKPCTCDTAVDGDLECLVEITDTNWGGLEKYYKDSGDHHEHDSGARNLNYWEYSFTSQPKLGQVFHVNSDGKFELCTCNLPDPEPEPVLSDQSASAPTHVHSFTWGTIIEPTIEHDGLEGEVCSCGAVRNAQPLSAYGYALNEYATPMINAAKSGQTITFEFGEYNSFPKSFMEKLIVKSAQNVTFVFEYKWNHKLQTITIPAGTPIDLNFDWYGPAKMAELYGAN